MNAVSASGTRSMSDSWISWNPRIDEPSNPIPSSKIESESSSAGTEKCCIRPGRSQKRKSTISAPCSFTMARTSLGVATCPSPLLLDDPPSLGGRGRGAVPEALTLRNERAQAGAGLQRRAEVPVRGGRSEEGPPRRGLAYRPRPGARRSSLRTGASTGQGRRIELRTARPRGRGPIQRMKFTVLSTFAMCRSSARRRSAAQTQLEAFPARPVPAFG